MYRDYSTYRLETKHEGLPITSSHLPGQGLDQIVAYDSYCLLICFPIELMNTIFSSNMQPAMYFKLCSILVQLWLELSQFGAS